MNVLRLIEEVERKVPPNAPFGSRCKLSAQVATPNGRHTVAVAARIDASGQRRLQYWCDGSRLELPVLLRLTCSETECPHAVAVYAQWQAYQQRGAAPPAGVPATGPGPQPLMAEVAVTVGRQRFVARPARFPCFTRCPHKAHAPLTIDKTGFDLFEDGACLGGGVVEQGGVRTPRIPSLPAAEAFVLARHLEMLAALRQASETSRPDPA